LRTRRVSPPRRSPPAEAPSKDEPLGIVGLGHVGLATAIAFVGKGREVWGLEADPVRVRDLEAGRPWFTEEGLLGALQRSLRTGRLHVTSDRRALLTHARVLTGAWTRICWRRSADVWARSSFACPGTGSSC
jgi:UDP-N-acetyl-D-mannosaminuronate dehydrogenase